MNPALHYRAFLSYCHQDEKLCARLHRKLEGFRVPKALRAKLPDKVSRLSPVFRDRDELGTADSLSSAIQHALDQSEALIVVCSPAAVASRWVDQEIRYFRRHYPERHVFAFVIGGDPGLDPRIEPDRAAIPTSLLLSDPERPDGPTAEPLAADARAEGDGFESARLKLIAGLLEVGYDDLRHREQRRQQRRWAAIAVVSLLLSASFAFLAWQATIARDQARTAQALAELELASERQTRGFLLSVFQLSDAGEARGNQVTVREVLDRAIQRIDSTQFARPLIKSSYLATLGRVYSSLGLNRRAEDLLTDSLLTLGDDLKESDSWSQFVDVQIELANLLFDMGDYQAALKHLDQLQQRARSRDEPLRPEPAARLANVRGDILSFMEQDAAAGEAYRSALAALEQAGLEQTVDAGLRGHSRYGLAQLAMFAGEHDRADQEFASAQALLASVLGERHPRTIATVITRGANAFQADDKDAARDHWIAALEDAEAVYDPDSPQLGTLRNNLGRLQLEAGHLQQAEPMLRAALRSDRLHRTSDFDDLAYPLTNLGILVFMQGETDEARKLLEEALQIAEPNQHPMLGAASNHLADLLCINGEVERGRGLALQAVEHAEAQYGADNWRRAQAELTRWSCERSENAAAPIDLTQAQQALQQIEAATGKASPFSRRAQTQLQALSRPRASSPANEPEPSGAVVRRPTP